jgi:hypothetical protein
LISFCRKSTADGKEAFFIKIKADTSTRNLRGYKNYISKKSEKTALKNPGRFLIKTKFSFLTRLEPVLAKNHTNRQSQI